MKKLTPKLLNFLPLVAMIVCVNYSVDPANIFKTDEYVKSAAKILLQGKIVANLNNYDERVLQRAYVQNLAVKKDVVIIGSSRSMGIEENAFPGKAVFNNSVSGATIEDYIAIYQLYKARKLLPNILILGLDPWILNKNNGQFQWKALKKEYNQFTAGGASSQWNDFLIQKWLELFSLSYFQYSVETLWKNLTKPRKREAYFAMDVIDLNKEHSMKLPDGSYYYDRKTRDKTLKEITQDAVSYAQWKPIYSLGVFFRLDSGLMATMEKFLDVIAKDHVQIVFFLPSYHPVVYKKFMESSEYSNVLAAERYFRDLALKKNIKIIGSYNPADAGLGDTDFLDGMHMKHEAYKKAFEKMQ